MYLTIPDEDLLANFSEKKVLVIDDYIAMQGIISTHLRSFWVTKIAVANNSSEAISLVKWQVFDAILCDYNLWNDKKDGHQILEEMRSCNHIPPATVFFMLTAESNFEKVIAAAEYAPDEYIVKPFNFNVLKYRLSLGFQKKAIFLWITEQMMNGDFAAAIVECDAIAKKNPKFRVDALRLKWKLLLSMNKAKDAEELYGSIVNIHPIPWAVLGLARAYRMQRKYGKAEALLDDVIQKHPEIPESYDLLAGVQGDQGKYAEMQKTLQLGVNASPKSLKRQRQLGDIALENNDTVTAEIAYKKIVEEKYSHVFKPTDMATLARLHFQKDDLRSARALVDNNRKFLNVTDEGQIIVSVTLAQVSTRSGDTMTAKRHIENALWVKRKHVNVDPAVLVDLADVCLKNSMNEAALAIGSELKSANLKKKDMERLEGSFAQAGLEIPLPKKVTTTPSETKEKVIPKPPVENTEKVRLEIASSNGASKPPETKEMTFKRLFEEGVTLFKNNDFRWAYAKFWEALKLAPTNQRTALNYAITIAYILNREGRFNINLIREGRATIASVGMISSQSDNYKNYQKLINLWERVEVRFGTVDKIDI